MRLALLTSFVIAAVATWPVVIAPAAAVLGHPGNDVWNHVWGYWWVAREIAGGHLPLHTDLMHFPDPGGLFFIDTFGAVLFLPVTWVFGPVVAVNLSNFVSFFTAAFAAWLLGRHVLGEVRGHGADTDRLALLAAVAYALSPHLLAQAYNGITETLFAFGLPLSLLAAVRFAERPTLLRATLAGLAGAVCTLANWYYGLFSVIGVGLFALVYALGRRERIAWRALPRGGGLAAGLALVLVAPVLLGFVSTLNADDALVGRDPDFVWKSLLNHNITDVVSLFRGGKVYSPDLKATTGEDLLIVPYLGWVLLGLAGFGAWKLRRWRDRAPWVLWVGVFGLLALGPYLYVDGAYLTIADRKVPLPFLALFELVPVFQRISHPFRFVVPVQLGLAMLALFGAAALPRGMALGAAGLVCFETLVTSPAPWPLPRASAELPAYVQALAEDPVPGAVLDLPAMVPNLERAVYLYWQTAHGRPSPYSLNEPLPAMLQHNHLTRAVLVAESGRIDSLPPVLGDLDLVASGRALARLGVRYVVVHERLYPPDRLAQVQTLLRGALGPETMRVDGEASIWTLTPPSLAAAAEGAP